MIVALSVIADLGGLLGLFMGASLISFVEVIYNIVQVVVVRLKKRQKVEAIEAIESNDIEMQSMKIQKLSQVVQILDHKQRESSVKILNLESRIEKLKSGTGKNDDILKSLEEIIHQNRVR
jgi:predicted transcriptional regulator